MHILTKVFVFIAAVLSLLLAVLTVSYTVNADRITGDYRAAVDARTAAENALSAQSEVHRSERERLNSEIQSLQQELAQRDATLRNLEAENSRLVIDQRRAQSTADSIMARISQLGVTTQTQAALIESYKEEVTGLRTAELRYREERLDLEDQLSDLESQILVFQQTQRALQERLAEARQEIEALRAEGGIVEARAERAEPVELSGPVVSGRVLEVRPDPATGETLVRVNLGNNDRIRDNTRLYVARGADRYLGDLVIFQTDLNWAIGRMSYKRPGEEIREGDRVLSRLDR